MRTILLTGLAAIAPALASSMSVAQPVPKENAGTITLLRGRAALTLHTCANNGANIQCDFTLKSLVPAATDYKYDTLLSSSRMVDDTHVEHALRSPRYFVVASNGLQTCRDQ